MSTVVGEFSVRLLDAAYAFPKIQITTTKRPITSNLRTKRVLSFVINDLLHFVPLGISVRIVW